MFIVSVQSSETSNSKTVCFSSWIIWNFTKRPCCQSSSAPSLSDQNHNCCVARQWSLCGKLSYRIWHLLVAEGFTSLKARQVWMEWVKTSARYLAKSCPWLLLVLVLIPWGIKKCVCLKSACFTFLWGRGIPFPSVLNSRLSLPILSHLLWNPTTHANKGRYTRRILLLDHAPGARSESKAPPCVPTISWVYFILGSSISIPQKNSTIFNRLNIWEQNPWANWANLKTLPLVFWPVQNEPGACSGSKALVYRS